MLKRRMTKAQWIYICITVKSLLERINNFKWIMLASVYKIKLRISRVYIHLHSKPFSSVQKTLNYYIQAEFIIVLMVTRGMAQ